MDGNDGIQRPKAIPSLRVRNKWGSTVTGGATGFQPLPDIFVRSQARLGDAGSSPAVATKVMFTPKLQPTPRSQLAKEVEAPMQSRRPPYGAL